ETNKKNMKDEEELKRKDRELVEPNRTDPRTKNVKFKNQNWNLQFWFWFGSSWFRFNSWFRSNSWFFCSSLSEKAQQEEEANIALIETWDDVRAKINADYQLAERLQAEEQQELNDEEKATLFMLLLEKKRKFFAAKRVEEKRNKPPTQAQQRKIMCTYLKNVEGKKLTDLKNKSFDSIQKMFDKAFKRPSSILDWKIHKEGKRSYYKIIRTDESSKIYLVSSHMLKSFDRRDVETLWKLVKAKHGLTRLEGDYERVLWGDLKVIFEPSIEDEV
nr:hypothetical protein [Tanacetum cinerariifolium]